MAGGTTVRLSQAKPKLAVQVLRSGHSALTKFSGHASLQISDRWQTLGLLRHLFLLADGSSSVCVCVCPSAPHWDLFLVTELDNGRLLLHVM